MPTMLYSVLCVLYSGCSVKSENDRKEQWKTIMSVASHMMNLVVQNSRSMDSLSDVLLLFAAAFAVAVPAAAIVFVTELNVVIV